MTIRKILFLLVLFSASIQAKPRYAIGMFHYNFQYVAGDFRIESRIVKESLYPALQFFDEINNTKLILNFKDMLLNRWQKNFRKCWFY
jgi:hypothetical protein